MGEHVVFKTLTVWWGTEKDEQKGKKTIPQNVIKATVIVLSFCFIRGTVKPFPNLLGKWTFCQGSSETTSLTSLPTYWFFIQQQSGRARIVSLAVEITAEDWIYQNRRTREQLWIVHLGKSFWTSPSRFNLDSILQEMRTGVWPNPELHFEMSGRFLTSRKWNTLKVHI